MEKDAKILIAGARGLVGSALVNELREQGFNNLLVPRHSDVDFEDPVVTKWYFSVHELQYVFFCAAKVGGIADNVANKIDFLTRNLHIELNVLEAALAYRVQKFLFVGTSCCYPRDCPQPMKEEYLWSGPLEKTTEAYSVAKLAGIKLCQYYKEERDANFVVALPCNIFGGRDNFNPRTAHCLPGMMARMHRCFEIGDNQFEVWGDGTARREFIYAPDLAQGLITVMEKYNDVTPINTGSGFEMTMRGLAELLAKVIGYQGEIVYDPSRPTGTPRKVLDNSKIAALGWAPQTPFLKAVQQTYTDAYPFLDFG